MAPCFRAQPPARRPPSRGSASASVCGSPARAGSFLHRARVCHHRGRGLDDGGGAARDRYCGAARCRCCDCETCGGGLNGGGYGGDDGDHCHWKTTTPHGGCCRGGCDGGDGDDRRRSRTMSSHGGCAPRLRRQRRRLPPPPRVAQQRPLPRCLSLLLPPPPLLHPPHRRFPQPQPQPLTRPFRPKNCGTRSSDDQTHCSAYTSSLSCRQSPAALRAPSILWTAQASQRPGLPPRRRPAPHKGRI